MTWARLDDQTARNHALRAVGQQAALLWYAAVTECAAVDGDGHMSAFMVEDTAHLFRVNHRRAAPALVGAALWHDHESVKGCGECMDRGGDTVKPGAFFIHEWWIHLLHSAGKNDPIKRKHEARRKALARNKELCARIRERDRDLCRYCGVLTTWGTSDRRSKRVGQYDHVDPWGENSYDNVVVACKGCNSRKRDRTPEQAGMIKLEPGTTQDRSRTNHGHDRTNHGHDQGQGDKNQGRPRVTREAGQGRIGPGSGPDVRDPVRDPVRGQDGPGPGPDERNR